MRAEGAAGKPARQGLQLVKEGRARAAGAWAERVREEGLEQCRAAVSSLANLSDLGVRQRKEQAGDPRSLQPGRQPSGQEVTQGRPALPQSPVYLSIHLQQSAYSWFKVHMEPWKSRKKKIQPPRNPQIQEFHFLIPRTWGHRTASQCLGWQEPCLLSEFCPRASLPTSLRPPVKFLDSTNEQTSPRCREPKRNSWPLSTSTEKKSLSSQFQVSGAEK